MKKHMSNRWKAALAWIASMSVVWTLFVPRGVSLPELVAVGVAGLVVLVISALWAKTEAEPLAVRVPVRISKGLR
jgi:hypothetical protein